MKVARRKHRVTVSVGGMLIDGWTSYEIKSSLLDPVDTFTLSRPFNRAAYKLCRVDAEVEIRIDDTTIIRGLIDEREKETVRTGNTFTITGRDMVGRLVQESAPTISYDGDFVTIVGRLAKPWFDTVVTSNARNRNVRRGKRGRKAAASSEDIVVKVRKKTWQVEPGQMRWKIINELASEAGYMVWSSADGQELVIGQPNYKQAVQFLVCNPDADSSLPSTSLRLHFKESIADRYSLVMALGSGRGDAANYGESAVSQRYVIRNGPKSDGTGADFVKPKRLILAERTLMNVEEARQYAQQEMSRRDFHKMICTATMPGHGQIVGSSAPTLYAPDTIARVIDEDQDPPINGAYLIFECSYRSTRQGSESTEIVAVPSGTVFVQ